VDLTNAMQNMPSIVSSATFAFQSAEMIGEEVYRGKRGSSPSVSHRTLYFHDVASVVAW
jgi:hypothetical protein